MVLSETKNSRPEAMKMSAIRLPVEEATGNIA
jgi:hypothetical protein